MPKHEHDLSQQLQTLFLHPCPNISVDKDLAVDFQHLSQAPSFDTWYTKRREYVAGDCQANSHWDSRVLLASTSPRPLAPLVPKHRLGMQTEKLQLRIRIDYTQNT